MDNPLWITAAAGCRLLCGGAAEGHAGEARTTARQGRTSFDGRPKAIRGKCERRGGNINADGAGAEVFAGDGCSQGASFGPMALISRRGQGGRISNNTRTREPLRRKCVKPHRPHNTFPAEDLLPPPQPRRTPADLTTHSPPKACSRPRTATRPSRALPLPHAAQTRTRRPHNPFSVESLLPPPHCDTPFPSTFAPPRSADARPPTSPPIPHRRPAPAPAHFRSPTQPRRTPADPTTHSPPKTFARPRSAALPPPPFRFGHKKNGTAQWMCDAECLGRPSLRSVIGVGEPRAVRRRCGALAWRVGLRPQPWALRSRRCGRVLRA